jgi:hypothetical protein
MASESGISPLHFGLLSYRDLSNHLEGFARAEKSQWRRTRLTAYMIYATHAKDAKTIEDWMPLDGDSQRRTKKLITKQQYAKLKKAWPV